MANIIDYEYDSNENLIAVMIEDDGDIFRMERVRRGRWNADGRCTNCGAHAPYWAMASTYHKSPYCFECGVEMDLEDN